MQPRVQTTDAAMVNASPVRRPTMKNSTPLKVNSSQPTLALVVIAFGRRIA